MFQKQKAALRTEKVHLPEVFGNTLTAATDETETGCVSTRVECCLGLFSIKGNSLNPESARGIDIFKSYRIAKKITAFLLPHLESHLSEQYSPNNKKLI